VLEVFDREYFVEFGFAADQPIRLESAPAGCSTSHHRPQELDAQIMSVLSVIPPDQRGRSATFWSPIVDRGMTYASHAGRSKQPEDRRKVKLTVAAHVGELLAISDGHHHG
jgi:hypothetical protein